MHYRGSEDEKAKGKVSRDLGGSVYLLTLPCASDATLPSVDFQRECNCGHELDPICSFTNNRVNYFVFEY